MTDQTPAQIIHDVYTFLSNTPSDINEHLPVLYKYAKECSHITECGVRSVVSTFAFANGLLNRPKHTEPPTLVMVDPVKSDRVEPFLALSREAGIVSVFHEQSDLECPLEPTDLLFVDSWHVYALLKRELERWHPYVRKYIAMHDTEVDKHLGETIRCGWDAIQQSQETGFPIGEILLGLQPAIDEFLNAHPEWKLNLKLDNNNGLIVLERITSI